MKIKRLAEVEVAPEATEGISCVKKWSNRSSPAIGAMDSFRLQPKITSTSSRYQISAFQYLTPIRMNAFFFFQVFQELFIQAKSRIALSPAVRKRRQSLPARTLIPPGTSGSNPHPQLGHHLSLHGSNVAAAAAAAAATAAATSAVNSSVSSSPTGTSSFAKRNSCTVS